MAFGHVGDHDVLVSGGIGNTVLMWDADSLVGIGEMECFPGRGDGDGDSGTGTFVKSLVIIGSKVYGVGGNDRDQGEVLIWDAETRELVSRVALPRNALCACHLTGYAKGLLLVGDVAGAVHLIELQDDD
jgi:hypothetical protein